MSSELLKKRYPFCDSVMQPKCKSYYMQNMADNYKVSTDVRKSSFSLWKWSDTIASRKKHEKKILSRTKCYAAYIAVADRSRKGT